MREDFFDHQPVPIFPTDSEAGLFLVNISFLSYVNYNRGPNSAVLSLRLPHRTIWCNFDPIS